MKYDPYDGPTYVLKQLRKKMERSEPWPRWSSSPM